MDAKQFNEDDQMKLTTLKSGADMNALHDAVAAAAPGDGIIYYRGKTVSQGSGGQIPIAAHAYSLFQRGKVLLVQKSTGRAGTDRMFEYIAIKRAS